MSVFSVHQVGGGLNKEPSRVSEDVMARLMTKPAHKTTRMKYEPDKPEC